MAGWRYAFSLSKDEVAASEPPGTEKLIEHELARTTTGTTYQDDHIQLVPKPSSSPRDPLNWPMWRKYAVLFTMSLYAGSATFSSAVIAPSLPLLQFELLPPRSLTTLTHLVSVNILLFGVANIFVVPLANVFGRRPILVASTLLATLSSIWAGAATSFDSILAARAVQGIGIAAAETIAPDVVGEVFFLHQRGRTMAIYTGFLGAGSFVGGLGGGYIAARLGYKYMFWISAAVLGFTFLCEVFLVPETLFDRASYLSPDVSANRAGASNIEDLKESVASVERVPQEDFTYLQSLKLGMYRGDILRQFLAPWYSLLFPGTWVVMLQYGGLVGGVVTMVTVGPIILSEPPYLWGANVGLLSLGGLVGNILAAATTYLVADRLVKVFARRKVTGLTEPETRLIGMVPALILATAGNWVYGFSADTHSPHAWAGLAVGLGMVGYGLVQIPSIGFNYLIESYNAISNDCFVMTSVVRSIISFVWTFFVTDWVFSFGASLPFGIFGMLMGIFGLLTVPLYFYGKRMRIATASWLPTEVNH